MAVSHMTGSRGSGYSAAKGIFPSMYVGVVGYTGFGGTAALPAYSFEEDPDTGIYASAANTLNIACGGTNVQGYAAVGSDTSIAPTTAPRVYLIAFTPSATTSASVVVQTVTVTGLSTADTILTVNPPTLTATAAFIAGYWVAGANSLAVAWGSITGTPTPPAANGVTTFYRVVAVRSAS